MKKLSLFLVALTMILFSCKPEVEKPTVVTKSVGEVTKTSAKVVGQVAADGGADVTERGVCWSTDGTPTILDFSVKDTEGGLGSYEIAFTDLVPNTQYYVRAYATNEAGTGYGDEKTFVTVDPEEPENPENPENPEQPEDPEQPEQPENPENPEEPEVPEQPEEGAPVVTTAEVTEITLYSAKCGGGVSDGGGAVVVERGVCWNTSGNPTVLDFTTKDGSGLGSYISSITGLEYGTTYYVRAYAANANGVAGYGKEVSFTTLDKLLPTVTTTAEVTDITVSSATCGGEVTFNGNVSVTARGICWSTKQNPTIEDDKTIDGSGVGIFTSNLSNLERNTTYYVRAYATNEVGTAYGEEVTFTTLERNANGHTYVDLGLPSGLLWATCNVGATSPEEYGDYFAWGETSTKETYDLANCPTYGLGILKLCSDYGYIDSEGHFHFTSQYDAATANWGGDWRMPDYYELNELRNSCTWTWTTQNGVNGYKVIGPSGASIFLPATGFRNGSSLYNAGSVGSYWSSMPTNECDDAFILSFDSDRYRLSDDYRYRGQSVRPVLE